MSPPGDATRTERHPWVSDLLRKLAGGSLPLAGIGVFPGPATTAVFLIMAAASASHPVLVVFREWKSLEGWRGRWVKARYALRPANPSGRTILHVGGFWTAIVLGLFALHAWAHGAVRFWTCVSASGCYLVSFLHASGTARREGTGAYQLRHTAIAVDVADAIQKALAFFLRDDGRAQAVLSDWLGVYVDEERTSVLAVRSSPRQPLIVIAVAVCVLLGGVAEATVGQPEKVGQPPRAPAPAPAPVPQAAAPGPSRQPGAEPPPLGPPPTVPWATELCGGDPREALVALFGASRRDLADGVANLLESRGFDTTGCPGPPLLQLRRLTVVPLKGVLGRQPSYVVVDVSGGASVIDPEAFAVLGQPDGATPGGFRAGVLTGLPVVRISGPHANARRPEVDTPAAQRNDRKAYLMILHLDDGSCAAATRTEPQKQFVILPPAVAALAGDFAVRHGFLLVTPVGDTFGVQAYDARAGFVDELTISYVGGVASVVGPEGGTETDTAACRLDGLTERRYPST